MIPSLTPASALPLAAQADSTIVPLQQRLAEAQAGAAPLPADTPSAPDFGDDPLAQAFLAALRTLPPCDDPRDYAAAVSQLMREFVDPATGQPAFVTLEEQSGMLQRVLAEIGPDDPLAQPVQATLIGTANLQSQMSKWMQDICMSDGTPKEFEEW